MGGVEHAGGLTFNGACVARFFSLSLMCIVWTCLVKCCVVPACFRLAARVMDPSFPPVLSCLRAAIPLSFVLLLRLCGLEALRDALWR